MTYPFSSQSASTSTCILSLHLLFIFIQSINAIASTSLHQKVYVVYMGDHDGSPPNIVTAAHMDILSSVKGSMEATTESILYSYKHSFSGFSARLSSEEAADLSSMPGVLSVFQSMPKVMHTTRSWQSIGMQGEGSTYGSLDSTSSRKENIWERARYGKDIVIGLLDSGIWPESESFNDIGMTPIPSSWKGACQEGDHFNASSCNRKLIGARTYIKGYESAYGPLNVTATGEFRSARDKDGHGTHTSSTAGGRRVANASALGGFAEGEASGGAPLARIAMYKVCWPIPGGSPAGENTCMDADMLAALDDAVADGVHVLSISIGSHNPQPPFSEDSIAIGALHAVGHNILVSCAAGNDGPAIGSVSNVAPWILTVAATSVDRSFSAPVILGNGLTLKGETVTPTALEDKSYPLILGVDGRVVDNSIQSSNISAWQCLPGSLDPSKVKGKIVMCLRGGSLRVEKGAEVQRAGGAAVILGNLPLNGNEISVDPYLLPGTAVSADVAEVIVSYINETKDPVAKLPLARTVLGIKPSPFVAAFSSQGPNSLNPDILKPDISAPGLNILAAWSEANSPTKLSIDKRVVKYNIFSGTSMSCPHVSGSAALLKAIHPDWSPSAIKSALMTTASILNNQKMSITDVNGHVASPFNIGSGELNPSVAVDPGLVYDASYKDYVSFLCNIGYNQGLIKNTTASVFNCPSKRSLINNLNYPTVAAANLKDTLTLSRTVKNVGGKSKYRVSVEPPEGVSVKIIPSILSFRHAGEEKTFKIKLRVTKVSDGQYVFGSFTWEDEHGHRVRSPIAVIAN